MSGPTTIEPSKPREKPCSPGCRHAQCVAAARKLTLTCSRCHKPRGPNPPGELETLCDYCVMDIME